MVGFSVFMTFVKALLWLAATMVSGQNWNRQCWPSHCGPGRGPWPDRAAVEGSEWMEDVSVAYAFESNVDDTRKITFRSAVAHIRERTCIGLVEYDLNDVALPSNRVEVGIYDTNSCYLSGMGVGVS